MKLIYKNNIAKLLDDSGYSIKHVSEKCGIRYYSLYNIVHNSGNIHNMTVGTACKLAKYFGVTIEQLIGEAKWNQLK